MDGLTLFGIAIGLSMDAMAVAIATSISLGRVNRRQVFRFGFHFGLFQAVMPALGWLLGRSFATFIQSFDHWVAFVLLLLVGGKACWEGIADDPDDGSTPKDPTRGISLVMLSVATSIDALAVGLSFAMLEMPIVLPCVFIGLVTASLTVAGMLSGAAIGARLGKRMRIVGGLVLIGIGFKIVMEHLS